MSCIHSPQQEKREQVLAETMNIVCNPGFAGRGYGQKLKQVRRLDIELIRLYMPLMDAETLERANNTIAQLEQIAA